MACQEVLEAHPECKEPTPEDMEAVHEEVPKECTAVKPVGAQHRGWHLAVGWCQKPKERTWGNCGFQKRLTITGRKVTSCAKMAWNKGNGKMKTRLT
jgi:hypothetical protein